MAKELWKQPIDKYVNWAGDESTYDRPVAGEFVQKFLKETLDKKFGYLHYNETAGKYYLFADKENYDLWERDNVTYAKYLLFSFDAPAPAVISIRNYDDPENNPHVDGQDRTIIKGETGQTIKFNYKITDNNKQPITEAVIMRVTFTSNGNTQTYSQTFPANARYAETGYPVTFNIDKYIQNAGEYTITVSLTGTTTQATASIIFMCTVIELSLDITFDNLKPIENENSWFTVGYSVSGGVGYNKMVEIIIDGENLYQDALGWGNALSTGSLLTSDNSSNGQIYLFMKDNGGEFAKWPSADNAYQWPGRTETLENTSLAGKPIFSGGKHSLQIRTYIMLETTPVYSDTKYIEFVVKDENIEGDATFLLYSTSLLPGQTFEAGTHIQTTAKQYSTAEFTTSVININGNVVTVKYDFFNTVTPSEGTPYLEKFDSLSASVPSGESTTLNYTFREAGNKVLTIYSPTSEDIITIDVNVTLSEAGSLKETAGAIFKYTALNKQNSVNKGVWKNEAVGTDGKPLDIYKADAIFNDNVLFIDGQDGWTGQTLRLKNGGAVTFPINLFAPKDIANSEYDLKNYGLSFEIEFTTSNVLSDDARILEYYDTNNRSYIKITATSAEIMSQRGSTIKTNFKENDRIKLAFIINPIRNINDYNQVTPEAARGITYPNTLMIMVNGVLDRACRWGDGEEKATQDSFAWNGNVGNSFTVGDLDNAATVDITSIRLYTKSLELDDEFVNYMYDSPGDEIEDIYKKNDIIGSNDQIDFEKVRTMIPTMVIGIDYRGEDGVHGINSGDDKKNNYSSEVQYFDNIDPSLNFFAKNVWISCQGTSSMKYPTKNLRIYFGKTLDKKTKHDIKKLLDNDNLPTGENASLDIYEPEYETEFFPYAVYGGEKEDQMTNLADEMLPYSTNKKVDGKDGTAPCEANGNIGIVHEGYHKIGSNLTWQKKLAIVRKYTTLKDAYWVADSESDTMIDRNHTPEFYIIDPTTDKPGSDVKTKLVKNAFDKTYRLYASTGFKGYESTDGGQSWASGAEGYKKHKVDCFKLIHIVGDTIKEYPDTTLSAFLSNGNDIYISAYRPLANNSLTFNAAGASDALWQYEKELRYTGAKFYTRIETYGPDPEDETKQILKSVKYEEVTKKTPLNKNVFYFSLGTYWRQYNEKGHISGWTDRWTLKADFAESSMCHNAGIGRLWTEALKHISRTGAQLVQNIDQCMDVRTGCDGKPIVLFTKQLLGYNENTGKPVYGDKQYAGLFNIMTDKSSTKLFGFEDIYNENGTKVWDASNVQCWECLNNGSGIPTGISLAYDDDKDHSNDRNSKLGEDRLIFNAYEARFPDTGQERHEFDPSDTREANGAKYAGGDLGDKWPDDAYGVETNKLESFLRWLNFCYPAVKYTIGEGTDTIDGYNGNAFNLIPAYDEDDLTNFPSTPTNKNTAWYNYIKYQEAVEMRDQYITDTTPAGKAKVTEAEELMQKYNIYIQWEDSGNIAYAGIGETYVVGKDNNGNDIVLTVHFDEESVEDIMNMANFEWYKFTDNIKYEVVTKELSNAVIPTDVYCVPMESFDAKYRFLYKDESGRVIKDEELASKYKVDVYLTPTSGNRLVYVDETGTQKETTFTALGIAQDQYLTLNNRSLKGRTYMEYFNATWRQHLDPEKVAAYYIYITRFAAVDQVVKNTMMTTDNGYQWYFINYDNDTTLGVRNDGHLVYNWDVDRDTFDFEVKSYGYAGNKSALWNTLELCEDFMNLVRQIDKRLFEDNYLSASHVLEYLNEKQQNVWCERLYNAQEEKKYMSTFTQNFTLTNYLAFLQGTRESHRTWWVTKRWDLYDSKWNSGLFDAQQLHVFPIIDEMRDERQPIIMVTAASDYTFGLQANNNYIEDGWKQFIKKNESYLFEVPVGVGLIIGDTPKMFGPQKMKVLNFRPIGYGNRGSLSGQNNLVATEAGANWVNESGSLMTKLLIGSSDRTKTHGLIALDGINQIYSLEEIDIRNCIGLPSVTINKLNNLHRFRSTNSILSSFNPCNGVTLYEVSLPASLESLVLDEASFRVSGSEYKVYQSVDSYVSKYDPYNDEINTVTIKDAFTKNNIDNSIYVTDTLPDYLESAFKYCKTYVEDAENGPSLVESEKNVNTGYVFDYAPTAMLTQLSLKNVTGLDTYQFLLDWFDALVEGNPDAIESVHDENGEFLYAKCVYPVTLTGINWVLESDAETTAAQKFINIYNKFTWAEDSSGKKLFTGKVYLKDFDSAAYQLLTDTFGKEIFDADNEIVISAPAQIFFNVLTENVETQNVQDAYTYYKVVSGTRFEVKADIFPISKDINYVYTLNLASYAGGNVGNIRPGDRLPMLDDEHNKEVFGIENEAGTRTGIKLVNNRGYAYVVADPDNVYWKNTIYSENSLFSIDIFGYDDNGNIDYTKSLLAEAGLEPIYIKVINQVKPTTGTVKLKEIIDGQEFNLPAAFVDDETHNLKVHLGDSYNVSYKSIKISFASFDNQVSLVKKNSRGQEIAWITRDVNDPQLFSLRYSLGDFYNNSSLPIYLTIELNTENDSTIKKEIPLTISCIPAETMYIVSSDEGDRYDDGNNLPINDIKRYKYNVMLDPSNRNIDYSISIRWVGTQIPNVSIGYDNVNNQVFIDPIAAIQSSPSDEVYNNAYVQITAVPSEPTLSTLEIELRVNLEIRLPRKLQLVRNILPSDPSLPQTSELITYDDTAGVNPFDINLTRNEFHDGNVHDEIEYKPYKIVFKPVTEYLNTPTVEHIVINLKSISWGTSLNSMNPPITSGIIDSLVQTNGIKVGDYTLKGSYGEESLIKQFTINNDPYTSVDGMFLYVDQPEPSTTSNDLYVRFICDATYDNTESDDNTELITTTTQVFTFMITRSTHVSSTYKNLNTIDSDEGYTLYLVDKKNRFFEFTCSIPESGDPDESNITCTFASEFDSETTPSGVTGNASGSQMNPTGDWRGVGFVKHKPGTTELVPYFFAFTQYYKYGLSTQEVGIELDKPYVALQEDTHQDTLHEIFGESATYSSVNNSAYYEYCGYKLTKLWAELDNGNNMFNVILHKYDDVELYIPSRSELLILMGVSDAGYDPNGETMAFDIPDFELKSVTALVKYLKQKEFIYDIEINVKNGNLEDWVGNDDNYLNNNMLKWPLLFENNRYDPVTGSMIFFKSSSPYFDDYFDNNYYDNAPWKEQVLTRYLQENDETHEITKGYKWRLDGHRLGDINNTIQEAIIPFVHVN